jgi:hypothetical protein
MMKAEIKNCPNRKTHVETHTWNDRGFTEYQYIDAEQFCSITGGPCDSADDVELKDCPAFKMEWTPGLFASPDPCEKCESKFQWFSEDMKIYICDECGNKLEV